MIKFNSSAAREILNSQTVADAVHDIAETVAANARAQNHTVTAGHDLPVSVDDYTTDRAASSVGLVHPAGIGMQAKYGVLTKAAAAAGLEVTEK